MKRNSVYRSGIAVGKAWRLEIESTCSVSHDNGGTVFSTKAVSPVPTSLYPAKSCCSEQMATDSTDVTHPDGPRGPHGRLEAQKGNRSSEVYYFLYSKNILQVRSSLYFVLKRE